MKDLNDILEGLFDDGLDSSVTGAIIDTWLRDNAQGDFKLIKTKKGNKISGDITIKNAKGFMALNIIEVRGSFSVVNCDIENFKIIFADTYAKVTGEFNVTNCQELTSLEGIPYFINGRVNIINCPKLKDLGSDQCLSSQVSIMKCKGGRRFTQSTVQKTFPAAVRIFCSEEEELANINEALQDPILIRLVDTLKANGIKRSLREILYSHSIAIDKIDQSCCETFVMPNDEKAMLKAARRIVGRYNNSTWGFIIVEDVEHNIAYVYNSNCYCTDVTAKSHYRQFEQESPTEILDFLKRQGGATIYVYSGDRMKDLDVWRLQRDRNEAQAGVINTDKDSLKQMLRDQQARYRTLVQKIKAERGSEKYKAVVDKVDKIMQRFSKFMHKYVTDNKWATSVVGYRAGSIFDSIRKGYVNGARYQEYGVLYAFQNWSTSVVRTLSGEGSYSTPDEYIKTLEKSIEKADKELSGVGM